LYKVRVTSSFGLHNKGDVLTVDVDFLRKFGKYTVTLKEIDEPEEEPIKASPRMRKKAADGEPGGGVPAEGGELRDGADSAEGSVARTPRPQRGKAAGGVAERADGAAAEEPPQPDLAS